MSQRYLIVIFSLLFIAGAAFLFWQNDRELDPEQGKSWWTLSFTSPGERDNLSFTVENHSDQTAFRYEIVVDKMPVAEGTFIVKRGEKTAIILPLLAKAGERTRIIVTLDKEKKEIYRQ